MLPFPYKDQQLLFDILRLLRVCLPLSLMMPLGIVVRSRMMIYGGHSAMGATVRTQMVCAWGPEIGSTADESPFSKDLIIVKQIGVQDTWFCVGWRVFKHFMVQHWRLEGFSNGLANGDGKEMDVFFFFFFFITRIRFYTCL